MKPSVAVLNGRICVFFGPPLAWSLSGVWASGPSPLSALSRPRLDVGWILERRFLGRLDFLSLQPFCNPPEAPCNCIPTRLHSFFGLCCSLLLSPPSPAVSCFSFPSQTRFLHSSASFFFNQHSLLLFGWIFSLSSQNSTCRYLISPFARPHLHSFEPPIVPVHCHRAPSALDSLHTLFALL